MWKCTCKDSLLEISNMPHVIVRWFHCKHTITKLNGAFKDTLILWQHHSWMQCLYQQTSNSWMSKISNKQTWKLSKGYKEFDRLLHYTGCWLSNLVFEGTDKDNFQTVPVIHSVTQNKWNMQLIVFNIYLFIHLFSLTWETWGQIWQHKTVNKQSHENTHGQFSTLTFSTIK